MSLINMTLKQEKRVNKIIEYYGKRYVEDYISRFYLNARLETLTKSEAQKIITGLGGRMSSPIMKVYGRDV